GVDPIPVQRDVAPLLYGASRRRLGGNLAGRLANRRARRVVGVNRSDADLLGKRLQRLAALAAHHLVDSHLDPSAGDLPTGKLRLKLVDGVLLGMARLVE